MRLENKVALITGGGSGIGRASAVLFAREGARVVAADRDHDQAEATASAAREAGGEAAAISGDVTRSEDALRMVRTAVEYFGKLDIVVNSAGVTTRNALGPGASPEELWDRVIEVNLKGTYLVSWHAVPEMKRSGGGSIINLASIIGLVGYTQGLGPGGFNPYAASKGGVVQFTRNLAVDSAADNIRVNCI
jgi:NAD(P)-dependent dehydrogenase (short-subunit alcohol dehydrogenase family)